MTTERSGRVAYLVMSHRLPDQVARLAATLRAGSPGAPIVVHHDPEGEPLHDPARRALAAAEVRVLEPPEPLGRDGLGLLLAVLRAVRLMLRSLEFDQLVLLSGQDYPLRPIAEIEAELLDGPFDACVEAVTVAPARLGALARRRPVDEFTGRYFYRWARVPGPLAFAYERASPVRRAARVAWPFVLVRRLPSGVHVGAVRRRTPFTAAMPCRRGADWWILSRRAAETLDAAAAEHPELLRYLRGALAPSESYVATVLGADRSLRRSADHRRYVRRRPDRPSPDVLGVDALDEVLASGALFARKFDSGVDAAVLDALDERVRGGRSPWP